MQPSPSQPAAQTDFSERDATPPKQGCKPTTRATGNQGCTRHGEADSANAKS